MSSESSSLAMLGTIIVAAAEALARHNMAEVLQEEGSQVYEAAGLLGLNLSSLHRKLEK